MDNREQLKIQDLAELGGLNDWFDGAISRGLCPESWATVLNHSQRTPPVTIYLPSKHKLLKENEEQEESNDRDN